MWQRTLVVSGMLRLGATGLGAMVGLGAVGCAIEENGTTVPKPQITGLSVMAASVGEPVRIYGENFISREEGWVDVHWQGRFVPDESGSAPEPVDLKISLSTQMDGSLLWKHFGAYRVPFTANGDRTGRFEGHVWAENIRYDGTKAEQPASGRMQVQFGVKPSIIIADFRAVGDEWIAGCRYPTPNAINTLPYFMRARAIGFAPTKFNFVISPGLLIDGQASTSPVNLSRDTLTDEHALWMRFSEVPQHTDGYTMSIEVGATDAQGNYYSTPFTFAVRRPIQVYYADNWKLAQIYAPTPVSSCTPGGATGVTQSYSESTHETRSRTIGIGTDMGFEMSYGQMFSQSWGNSMTLSMTDSVHRTVATTDTRSQSMDVNVTDTYSLNTHRSVANRFAFSKMSGTTWHTSVIDEEGKNKTTDISGMGGFNAFEIVRVGGDVHKGWVKGTTRTMGESEGGSNIRGTHDDRTTDTHSGTFLSRARSQGFHWGVEQSYTEANSTTHSETMARTRSYEQSRLQSVHYGMHITNNRLDQMTVSTTMATSLETSGRVFPNMYGMWYRQASRFIREGTVVAYDLCGNGQEVGHVRIEDFTWAPDLALSNECPPRTNLPPAQCLIPPCRGQ